MLGGSVGYKFCPKCEKPYDTHASFCSDCGSDIVSIAPQDLANIISVKRLVFMGILSGWMYTVYWFYRTWKQYKNHTSHKAYPILHGLGTLVPIMDLFIIYGHFRDYGKLFGQRGVALYFSPAAAVIVAIASLVFSFASLQANVTDFAGVLAMIAIAAFPLLLALWVLVSMQINLNVYWSSFPSAGPAKIGKGEIIVAILGVARWLFVLLVATSDAFRTWLVTLLLF